MSDVTQVRDPSTDALLTPQNMVLALIDYQPEQYAGVASMPHDELVANVTLLGHVATAFELPVVLTTVPWCTRLSACRPHIVVQRMELVDLLGGGHVFSLEQDQTARLAYQSLSIRYCCKAARTMW